MSMPIVTTNNPRPTVEHTIPTNPTDCLNAFNRMGDIIIQVFPTFNRDANNKLLSVGLTIQNSNNQILNTLVVDSSSQRTINYQFQTFALTVNLELGSVSITNITEN